MKHKRLPGIQEWIESKQKIEIDYPDTTREAIEHTLRLGGLSL
jgi:hypothetical protein